MASQLQKKFLLKHVGNMGDLIFFIPPLLATLKKNDSTCHITFVTAWGYKNKKGVWGKRNQGGFSLNLIMTNPHIDQLIHWHDTKISLNGMMCQEEGKSFPTWNRAYFEKEQASGRYDGVYELDFGLNLSDNPIQRIYQTLGLPQETYSKYQLYLTDHDRAVAQEIIDAAPHPRIVLLEGLEGTSTRGWDPDKISALEKYIKKKYRVTPLRFGGKHVPEYHGRPLTLRENIATLTLCDVGIGVMSGPLHFAAAVGLPTLTLFCDQPLHRAAPAYFLNPYLKNPAKHHRTLLGPNHTTMQFLKPPGASLNLTPDEAKQQNFKNWQHPGRQATKSCLAAITVDEIMAVLNDMLLV